METGHGKSVSVDKNAPVWLDRGFMRALAITLMVFPLCAVTEVYIIGPRFGQLNWMQVTDDNQMRPIESMVFTEINDREIGLVTGEGPFFYERYVENLTGPLQIDNSSWYNGAYDAEYRFGRIYLTNGGENQSVFECEREDESGRFSVYGISIPNVTETARFDQIEHYYSHPIRYYFLGSPRIGVAKCRFPSWHPEFINTSNGLPSNSVRCIKVVGNNLLVGTASGFAFFDLETGTNFSCTENDLGETFSTDAIAYYQASHRIFVGTGEGLLIYSENGTSGTLDGSRKTQDDGLASRDVNALEIDKDRKRLYIGTYGGLSYIDLDSDTISIIPMVSREGFTHDGYVQRARCLLIPEYGSTDSLYIGTVSGALVEVPHDFNPLTPIYSTSMRISVYGISAAVLAGLWFWFTRRPHSTELDEIRSLATEKILEMGESQYIEFKSSMRWDYRQSKANSDLEHAITKTLAGFMNARGGILLIGVYDDATVRGLEPDYATLRKKNADGFELHLTSILNSAIGPEFRDLVRVSVDQVGGKDVFRVAVLQSKEPVFLKDSNGQRVFVVRQGGRSQTLDAEQTYQYIRKKWSEA